MGATGLVRGVSVESQGHALMRMDGVSKSFRRRSLWRNEQEVKALRDIELTIPQGTTFAIVGESGSGKSTLALCLAQLESVDAGEVWFQNKNLTKLSRADLAPLRKKIQLIFQDSASALSPRLRAIEIVSEPLDISQAGSRQQRRELSYECMRIAGLPPELAARLPLELSGGQRQRLAIARALTLSPELLIFDESFSGLDLVLEAQILELLLELKSAKGLTYLIITHDLSLVAGIADHVAVMHSGSIVEQGLANQVFKHAQHAHTQALLAAMPKWNIAQVAGSGA